MEHDGVIHLAGLLGTSETIGDPYPSVRTNVEGTLNLLEACKPRKEKPSGTPAVITTVGNHFMLNTYSITKSCAERFALMYNRELGTRVAVVRAYNAYGARQAPGPVRKLIPSCVAAALDGTPIEIFGTGRQEIDLISVQDVALVLVRALTWPHQAYGVVLEAGTGCAVTVNDVAHYVNHKIGSNAGLRHVPMRPGEPEMSRVVADPRTLEPIGVSASRLTPWQKGLDETIEWYRAHPEFLKPRR
jgi:nucleoside-diphosphate-sugar epimerase